MLAGRESEASVFGDTTTGAENDLVQATQLARNMLTRWGMGPLGPMAFDSDEEEPFLGYQLSHRREYSEATAARIDREIERVLAERAAAVRALLDQTRSGLDALAETLLKEETVGEEALTRILGPRAPAPSGVPSAS